MFFRLFYPHTRTNTRRDVRRRFVSAAPVILIFITKRCGLGWCELGLAKQDEGIGYSNAFVVLLLIIASSLSSSFFFPVAFAITFPILTFITAENSDSNEHCCRFYPDRRRTLSSSLNFERLHVCCPLDVCSMHEMLYSLMLSYRFNCVCLRVLCSNSLFFLNICFFMKSLSCFCVFVFAFFVLFPRVRFRARVEKILKT